MKSLFTLGAWSLAALAMTGAALAQQPGSAPPGVPYWVTSGEAAPVGSGVAPTIVRPPTNAYAPPPAPPRPQATFGPVNFQRDGAPSRVAPRDIPQADVAPGAAPDVAPGNVPFAPSQVGPVQAGPAQIGINPAQGGPKFTFDSGAHVEKPGYGFDKHRSSGWFGGVGGMFLDRDNGNDVWLSVDDANIADRVMTMRDAGMDTAGGFEVSVGRYFKNNAHAWQLTYWGVFPSDQNAYVYNGTDTVGNLGTSRTFDGVDYNGGTVASWFNTADAHWLRRGYQFHNAEWNILGNMCSTGCGGKGQALFGECGTKCGSCSKSGVGCGACGGKGCSSCYHGASASPWRWNWLAGVRYFRFDEDFTYAADPMDNVFNGAVDEVYYDIDIENNLFGFQVGGIADYCVSSRWNFRNAVKLGVYGSHITHHSCISGAAGNAVVNNINSPFDGDDWFVRSTKNDIAMLGEWDSALTYQYGCHWRARFGYRMVAVTGVALTGNQIPTATYTDLTDVAIIDSNGSLILHGGYASLEFCY